MKNWKIIAFIPAIAIFGLFFVYPKLFNIDNPSKQFITAGIAVILFIFIVFYIFKSKQALLFILLGTIFSISDYFIVYSFWKPYPQIAIVIFPIFLLLAVICFGIGTYKLIRVIP